MPAQGACFSAYALPRAAPKFAPGVYAKWGANRLRRLLGPGSFKVQHHGAKGSRCRRNRCPPQGGGAKLGGGGRKMLSSMFWLFFVSHASFRWRHAFFSLALPRWVVNLVVLAARLYPLADGHTASNAPDLF